MNKYKNALQNLIDDQIDTIDRSEPNYIPYTTLEDIELLKELINKETPMKPQKIDEPDLHYIYYCPKCGATLMVNRNLHPKHLFNLCGKCGQKLDWSGE